ncbi:MAG: hypothetical protein DRN25_07200 [Thermoplasmata archaeon]|nr:MAG: hypothetical protein DRN25_07200 [Thermoplasmata archaeon]
MSDKAVISGIVSGILTVSLLYKLYSMVPKESPLAFSRFPVKNYPTIMKFSSIVNWIMVILLALFFIAALFLVLIDQLKFLRIEEEMQK